MSLLMETPQESEIVESLTCATFLQYLLSCQTGIKIMEFFFFFLKESQNNFDRPIEKISSKIFTCQIQREII